MRKMKTHKLDRVPRRQGLVFTSLSAISLVSGAWLVCREQLLHDYVSSRTRSLWVPRTLLLMLLSAVPQSHLEDPTAQGVSQMPVDFLDLTAPGCGHVASVESVSCPIISRTGCLDPLGAPFLS